MAEAVKLQPLFLLSDEPIGISVDDGLGMNQTARVIAEAALGAATPFTVGIFGAWGHGKTSLLNAARTLLEPVLPDGTVTRPHPHVVTVQFNAWRYEKEEHPIVPLVASIARAVKQRLDDDTTFGRAVGEKGKAIATTLYDGALSLIGAVKLETKGRLGNPALAQVEGGIALDAGTAQKNLAARQAKREAAAQPRIHSWIDQSLYLSAFDDLARLHAAAKMSGANATGQAPVIVVFIDDLDRCRPEAAVEILEGIKLVLAQPGFVFVLALYREVIERYLDRQSEVRYGDKHKSIGEGYIDKIVQLPLWLPSHEGAFERYIHRLIDTKLADGLLPHDRDAKNPAVAATNALLDAVRQAVPLLARLSSHSPRKLVRKINELLIDDRLLPENAHTIINCKPEERRAILFPLCLIRRALLELPLPQQMKPLLENDTLCAALATYRPDLADKADDDGNVAPMLFRDALKAKSQASGPRDAKPDADASTPAPDASDPALSGIDAATAGRWLKATDCLSLEPYRAVLLNTTAGRAYLAHHAGRRLVAQAITTQAVTPAAPATKPVEAATAGTSTGEAAARAKSAPITISDELRQEIAIIERAVRKHLSLKADAPLGPAELARVTELNLAGDPITDAGAAWLARADSGLTALTSLYLWNTKITDAGAKALAAKDSGLTALTSLSLGGTQVTDAGAAALKKRWPGITIYR
ncbi:MAG: P-loop NTPase fold protein [Phycisphaerales bacterium]